MTSNLVITWQTRNDKNVCPICSALDGYKWVFPVGEGRPEVLEHPVYGVVWDGHGPRSHSHVYHVSSCRCRLIPDIEIKDMVQQAKDLLTALEKADTIDTAAEGEA